MDDDDDNKDYEMNMEKIMAKFTNFNTSMSNRSNATDDDDEEEEEIEVNRHEGDEDDKDDGFGPLQTVQTEPLRSEEPLVKEFVDSSYWVKDLNVGSVDDLLADYE
jgi:hypothetical protein